MVEMFLKLAVDGFKSMNLAIIFLCLKTMIVFPTYGFILLRLTSLSESLIEGTNVNATFFRFNSCPIVSNVFCLSSLS